MGTHEVKVWVKRRLPPDLLNATLLRLPILYRTPLVAFETNLGTGVGELLSVLERSATVPGDIIECGSSRAGTSVIMARWLKRRHLAKRVFACDSFAGFPQEELDRERSVGLTSVPLDAFTSTSYRYVQRKVEVLGLAASVIPIRGYFQDTLAGLRGPFCVALIDCDLQESLEFAAENVLPKISAGGFIVFDDYFSNQFAGARIGIEAFISRHAAEVSIAHGRRLYWVQKH